MTNLKVFSFLLLAASLLAVVLIVVNRWGQKRRRKELVGRLAKLDKSEKKAVENGRSQQGEA